MECINLIIYTIYGEYTAFKFKIYKITAYQTIWNDSREKKKIADNQACIWSLTDFVGFW